MIRGVVAAVVLASLEAVAPASVREATPAAGPLPPLECRVAPRTEAEAAALAAPPPPPDAPPEPMFDRWALSEADLPQGPPADAGIVAALLELERQAAGCLDAADWPRFLALTTDAYVRSNHDRDQVAAVFDATGTPVAVTEGRTSLTTGVSVCGARLLPDGRVAAFVETVLVFVPADAPFDRAVVAPGFHFYEEVDGRWLLAGDVPVGGDWAGCQAARERR